MKKIEKLMISFILLVSIIALGIMWLTSKSDHQNRTIMVKIDNETEQFPINNSNESKIYELHFNHQIAYIEAKQGKVRMLEMSKDLCPNGICSATGWIDKSYQSIVCLPNKIIVTVKGGKNEIDEIDIIP